MLTIAQQAAFGAEIRPSDVSPYVAEAAKRAETSHEPPRAPPVKLCRDCRLFSPADQKCGHDSARIFNFVTGDHGRYAAQLQRGPLSVSKDCGPEARYFVPALVS